MIIPRFDRQQSCVFSESFESIYDLRQRGIVSSAPTLSDGPTGRSAATFEGTDDKVVFVGRYSVKSAVGWVYLATITEQIVDFDGGSHYIHVSGGTVTATGWSTPTVYVDGAATTTIAAAGWHHIAVTTATAFAATNLQFATDNSAFGAVRLYGWTLWDRALSAAEVLSIYNRTVWDYDLYEVSHWDMSEINPQDVGWKGSGNHGTGTGLDSTNIVNGPYNGEKAIEFNGTDEDVDFGDVGSVRTISMLVKPATTTEELLLLDTGVDIMVSAGTITYTGTTASATYVDGVASTTLVADKWQHVVCVLTAAVDCNNFEAANDGAISIADLRISTAALNNLQAEDLRIRLTGGVS